MKMPLRIAQNKEVMQCRQKVNQTPVLQRREKQQ